MTEKDIRRLLAKGERVSLECKKAEKGVPNSLWATYSAFANTNGGVILLGVEENLSEKKPSKRFSITGVADVEKILNDFWNTINSTEKVNINLLQDEDVEVVKIGDKSVIVIKVPRADYSQRPIYINKNVQSGSYRRNHEGDYHCSEQMWRMMVRDAFEDGNDRLFLEGYTMDHIDIPTLERYRTMFRIDNQNHVWNDLNDKDFLIQLGGYVVNRKEKTEGLTMAGLLIFGKGLPIRERFGTLRMDYIDKSNLIGDERYSDRLTYDGTWENNIFNFFQMIVPRLTRDLPRPFRMEGIVRMDDTPQHKAVREAFTNMIIHADFMMNGLLRVVKFDDRFELTNPGLLKLPLEQIYAGGESKARNQRMQNMLRMIGYGENVGSGFPLILKAWEDKHWERPELIEQPELMQVKLVLHIDLSKKVEHELTDRQKAILMMIKENPFVTAKGMAEKLSITSRTLERELSNMQKAKLVIHKGSTKSGFWIMTEKSEEMSEEMTQKKNIETINK